MQLQLSGGVSLGNSSFTTTGAGSDGTSTGLIRTLSGANTLTGGLTLTGGGGSTTLRADTGSSLALNGAVTASATLRYLILVGGGDFTFGAAGSINDTSTTGTMGFSSQNSGSTTISSTANTYTLRTEIGNGNILTVASLGDAGANSSIGAAAATATNLVLDNGTLRYAGSTAQTTNRLFSLGANGATLDASGTGSGTMSFTGTGSLGFIGTTPEGGSASTSTAARTLVLAGSNTGSNTFAPTISDNTGATSLTKNGTGTWVLSGLSNTYSGLTSVNNGTLKLGANNALPARAPVVANGSTQATLDLNGFNQSLNGLILGGASATSTSRAMVSLGASGSLALNGGITYDASGNPLGATISGSGTSLVDLNGALRNFDVALSTNAAGQELTVSAKLSDTLTGGGITKSGSGNLVLSGANDYAGTTTVNFGALTVSNALSLGTSGAGTEVKDGASLQLQGGVTISSEPLTLSGSGKTGNVGALRSVSGANQFNGPITLAADARINSDAGTLTLGSVSALSGAYVLTLGGASNTRITSSIGTSSLVKDGAGTLTLTADNTYAGATTVNGGALSVTPTSLANSLTSVINVGANGVGELNLYADNAIASATLHLNTSLVIGGATTAGILGFQFSGTTNDSLILSGTGTLTVGPGGGVINARTLTTLVAGTSYLLLDATNTTPTTLTGFTIGSVPSGFSYSLDNSTPGKLYLSLGTAASGPYYWHGGVNGSWASFNAGASNWKLNNSGTNEAGATPGSSILVVFGTDTAANVSTTLDQPYEIDGLRFVANTPSTGNVTIAPGSIDGTLKLGVSGIDIQTNASSTVTTISAPLTLGANQTWNVTDAGQSLSVSGGLDGSGFSLTKSGAGTVTVSTVASYTGATVVNAGTLSLVGGNANTSSVTINGGTLSVGVSNGLPIAAISLGNAALSATLNLNGNSQTFNGITFGGASATSSSQSLIALGSSGTLTLGGNISYDATGNPLPASITGSGASLELNGIARTLTVGQSSNGAGAELTISANILDAAATGSLIKDGSGNLVLSGANAYAGVTTISLGALNVRSATGLGTTAGGTTVANYAALQLQGGITFGAEALTLNGSGLNGEGALENITNNNAFGGPITLASDARINSDAGTLTLNSGTALGGAFNLTLGGAGNITLSSVFNATSLTKDGAGTLTINSLNSSPLVPTGVLTLRGGITRFDATSSWRQAIYLDTGSTLTEDNSANVSSSGRLGGGTTATSFGITFRGGNFNLLGNVTSLTSERFAAPTFSRGYSVITVTSGNVYGSGAQTNLYFSAAPNNVAPAQTTAGAGASVIFRGSYLGYPAGPGVATISADVAGFTFNGQAGATGTTNRAILPWALVDTTMTASDGGAAVISFATASSSTSILRFLGSTEYTHNAVTTNDNVELTSIAGSALAVNANILINSLTMQENAGLSLAAGVNFNLSSGGILVRSGSDSVITGGVISQLNTYSPLNIWAIGNLTINSSMNGGNGQSNTAISTVKAGAGTLTLAPVTSTINGLTGLSPNSLSGQFVLNQGTLKMGDGVKNALQPNNFFAAIGGTWDLNGNSQQVYGFFSDSPAVGAGSIVTSLGGSRGNFIMNLDAARAFSGTFQGNINFARSGLSTFTLYNSSNFTGLTLLNGNTTTLTGAAAFTGTTGLDLSYATLNLDNTGTQNLNNRINDSAPLTLRGATLNFLARANTNSSETLGQVTFAAGNTFITPTAPAAAGISATLNLAGINRTTGQGTVVFKAVPVGSVTPKIYTSEINGVSTSAVGAGLINGIIGGWAIFDYTGNPSEFATYSPTLGMGYLGQTGFAAYTGTTLSNATASTANIKLATGTHAITANTTVNSLNTTSVAGIAVTLAPSTTLTINSGGILSFNNNSWTIGSVVNQGFLTSNQSELFVYAQGSAGPTVNAVISGNIGLVKSGAGPMTLAATNTYTGGTTIQQGTLTVAATGNIPLASDITKGLVINNAIFTSARASVVATGNIVTVNGGGIINLRSWASNTSTGVGTSMRGVLTVGGHGVTATSSNVTTTSVLDGRFDFGISGNTITVDPINVNGVTDIEPLRAGLSIQGIVGSTGGIIKNGNGLLQLSAKTDFEGNFTVAYGGIKTGVANGGSASARLILNSGTRFDLNNLATTWGSLAGSGDIFSSPVSSTANTPILQVGFHNDSTTFSGRFMRFNDASSWALTKVGTGTMTLDRAQDSNANYGLISVSGGAITYSGVGQAFVATATARASFAVNNNGILNLDNSSGNVNDRLGLGGSGDVGNLYLQGGKLVVTGNTSVATSETVANLNVQSGGGRIELNANANRQLNFTITTLAAGNGINTASPSLVAGANTGSLVIGGLTGASAANGVATLTITNANYTQAALQGGGFNASTNLSVRGDILADAAVSGYGTGFLVQDSSTLKWRALGTNSAGLAEAGELNWTPTTWAAMQNAGVASAQSLFADVALNTLTFTANTQLNSALSSAVFGLFGPGGNLQSVSLTGASALLVQAGRTVDFNLGTLTAGGIATPVLHVLYGATLNFNGNLGLGGKLGLIKADDGILNLNQAALYSSNVSFIVPSSTTTLGSDVVTVSSTADLVVGSTVTGTGIPTDRTVQAILNGTQFQLSGTGTGVTAQPATSLTFVPPVTSTVINGGTLNLNSGSANTLAVIPTAVAPALAPVYINGTNAKIDLLGNNQAIGILASSNPLPGAGGTITNSNLSSVAELTTSTAVASATFGGVISGNINFTRVGANTTTLINANTYTGTTTVRGGTLQLRDSGSILNSSSLGLYYGQLTIDQSGLNPLGSSDPIRVSNSTGITLLGGTIVLTATGSTSSTQTLGTVSASSGANTLTPTILSGQGSTNTLRISNLQTTNLVTNGGTINVAAAVGQLGFNQSYLLIDQLDGVAPATATWLGPNIIANSSDYASYVTGQGLGAMGSTGFLAYGAALVSGANTPTVINANTSTTVAVTLVLSANTTTGALKFGSSAITGNLISFSTSSVVLNLARGGLLSYNAAYAVNVGTSSIRGYLTTGGAASSGTYDLLTYQNQNTTTIEAIIMDSGNGSANTRLVKSGAGTLALTAPNTFTGGTIVNQGTLNLSATNSGDVVIPGNLLLNNAALTMSTTSVQQIAPNSNVTLSGGATFTLPNYTTGPTQTLASLTFINEGGSAVPTFSLGTPTTNTATLVLSSATPITVTNNSFGTTPVITGGSATLAVLQFSNANPSILVNAGLAPTGLHISATIAQHASMTSLTKTGDGLLALSGTNNFSSNFTLAGGSLLLGVNATLSGSTITAGPVGLGNLIIGNGTSILSNSPVRVLSNPVTVNGDFSFGGTNEVNNLKLAGTVTLGSSTRTISVDSAAVTATISGAVVSTASASGNALVKAGKGTLLLNSASNSLNGAGLRVSGGLLRQGVGSLLSASSLLTVDAGAGYDLNGFDQTSYKLAGNGFVTNSANASITLTLGNAAATQLDDSYTFGGAFADNAQNLATPLSLLAVTKVGPGKLTLTGDSIHSGLTSIQAGIIELASNGSFGLGIVDISSSASVDVVRTNELIFVNPLAGGGTFNQDGLGGKTILTADSQTSDFFGPINVKQGTLQAGAGATIGDIGNAHYVNISLGATFSVNRSDLLVSPFNLFNEIKGTGEFKQIGSGVTDLTYANAFFAGTVVVEAGTLRAAQYQALIKPSRITVQAAGLFTQTASAAVGATGAGIPMTINGGIVDASNDTMYLGALTFNGGLMRNEATSTTWSFELGGNVSVTDNSEISATLVNTNGVSRNITVDTGKTLLVSGYFVNSGAGEIVTKYEKQGPGTMTLTGDNQHTGGVIITQGVLQVGNNTSTGTLGPANDISSGLPVPIVYLNNASLVIKRSDAYALDNNISGTGSLTQASTNVLTLTGNNSYTGATIMASGTLQTDNFLKAGGVGRMGNVSSAANTAVDKLIFQGGKIEYVGAGETSERGLTIADNGGEIKNGGTGALIFDNAVKIDFANTTGLNRTLTFSGDTNPTTIENSFAPSLFETESASDHLLSKLVKNGTGLWVMAGSGAMLKDEAAVDVNAGVLGFAAGSLGRLLAVSSNDITLQNTTTLRWLAGNTDDLSARLHVANGSTVSLDFQAATTTTFNSSVIFNGAGSATINKVGTGALTLAARNDFSGIFNVNAGWVTVTHNTALGDGTHVAVNVNNTGTLVVNSNVGNNVSVATGGTLGGVGSVANVTLDTGAVLSPGNSPGTLTMTNLVASSGSTMNWQVHDASNIAVAGTGWDKIVVTNNFDLSAISNSSGRILINVTSLHLFADTVSGDAINWSKDDIKTFLFGNVGSITFNSGYSVNIADYFAYDTSAFTTSDSTGIHNSLWSMSYNSGTGDMTLTAVPEPSTYGLMIGALALAAAAIRRRKQKQKKV
ncbi:MAG: autotransporter-associated beta strand repeat-containing protein [Verrucomicrobia bacterium]|nr:autotransporter-associated beta strand repeat-containing protein [Verrucomicrobiota bacterium]